MDTLPSELFLVIIRYISPLDLLRLIDALPRLSILLTTKTLHNLADEHGNTILHLVAEAEILICGDQSQPGRSEFQRIFTPWKEGWQTKGGTNSQNAYRVGSGRRFPTRLPSCRVAQRFMKLFLGNPNIDPDLRNGDGASPLLIAVRRANYEIVKLLLDSGRVDPNLRCAGDKSPLCHAALEELDMMVSLLLSYDGVVDVNNWTTGGMPVTIFKSGEARKLLRALMNRETFDIEQHKLFSDHLYLVAEILRIGDEHARKRGGSDTGALEILLSDKRLDVNGARVLEAAAVNGDTVVLGHLLERDDIQVNLQNPDTGMTAVAYAAHFGHEHFTDMLLAHRDIDLDSQGNYPFYMYTPDS